MSANCLWSVRSGAAGLSSLQRATIMGVRLANPLHQMIARFLPYSTHCFMWTSRAMLCNHKQLDGKNCLWSAPVAGITQSSESTWKWHALKSSSPAGNMQTVSVLLPHQTLIEMCESPWCPGIEPGVAGWGRMFEWWGEDKSSQWWLVPPSVVQT